jgi:ABC-type multidrug transport system ATPase subunit
MDEADLCDRVALIQNGQILDIDSPSRITEKFPRRIIQVHSNNMYKLINDLREYKNAEAVYAFGQFAHFTGVNDEVETNELDSYLYRHGHRDVLVEEIPAGIEDVFMNLMESHSLQSQSQ